MSSEEALEVVGMAALQAASPQPGLNLRKEISTSRIRDSGSAAGDEAPSHCDGFEEHDNCPQDPLLTSTGAREDDDDIAQAEHAETLLLHHRNSVYLLRNSGLRTKYD